MELKLPSIGVRLSYINVLEGKQKNMQRTEHKSEILCMVKISKCLSCSAVL